jgi:predicted nucleotidyltransferase
MSKRLEWDRAQPIWEAAPNVIAAWAFGSARDGMVKPGSDVDIAVLTDALPSLDERIELLTKLQEALGVDEIDLVVLNGANVALRFEAISGHPLYCRDVARRAEFASLTAREYEDEMAFWQRALRAA